MPAHLKIRQRRIALGLSQEQLAARLMPYLSVMHKKNISKIETGLRKVAADELPFFAKALDCRVEDLLEPAE